jgi:hypothetical protein
MAIDEDSKNLIIEHFRQLKNKFTNLELKEIENGRFNITGNLSFTVFYGEKPVKDDYDVEIEIPSDYPHNPPTVKETSHKIPRNMDNHVNPEDGTICIAAPLAVKRTFAKERNLLWFVEQQLIRFLSSYSYKRDYGLFPNGELSHGSKGLLEYYGDLFSVQDNWQVLGLLKILADDNYRGHALCPCGSNKKVRNCHGDLLRESRNYQKPYNFMEELLHILKLLMANNTNKKALRKYVPKSAFKYINKRNRKKIKEREK